MTELLYYSFPYQMCNITIKIVADQQHYTLGHNYDAHSAKWPHKNKESHEYDTGFQQRVSFLTRLHGIHYDEQITHVLSSNQRVIESSQVVPVLNEVSRDFLTRRLVVYSLVVHFLLVSDSQAGTIQGDINLQ